MTNNSDVFPRKGCSGGGSCPAYSVEARHMYSEPIKIGDQIFTKEWKRVNFKRGDTGIPVRLFCREAEDMGLLPYGSAQALRWSLHSGIDTICLETRIVKHTVTWSHSETVEGAFDVISGADRSSIMPDNDKFKKPEAKT